MLREQYNSVFSKPNENFRVEDPALFFSFEDDDEILTNISFDKEDIIDQIDSLSSNAAAGPDGVPAILLKKCKRSIVDGLEILFRKFLKDGDLPHLMKLAFVIPVHKGGSRGEPVNFRPVSLTSHLMKTLERVIRKVVVNHLEVHKKLNPNQHGFRFQRSCLSQLLDHHDKVLQFLEDGNNVDTVYLDFSKAFDKVDIGILSHKLRDIGLTGNLGIFLHNFLSNREQHIIANGVKSTPSKVLSGVPQGTVLGPILFLIMINDIDKNSSAEISLFCDDTRIMKPIKTENDVEDLQEELEKLYIWETENNMKFNGKKFELLRFGKNSNLKEDTNYFTQGWTKSLKRKKS